MSIVLRSAVASVRVAGALSPAWGGAVALRIFAHVAEPRAVRPAEEPTMWRARRSTLRIDGLDPRGADVAVYEWGSGPRPVLLAHGWNGRASQFAPLIRELVAEGHRVVAFDAPAHGDSSGRRTYLPDWLRVFAALERRYGAFAGVVGHSVGGLAALLAVSGGLDAARVVTVGSPSDGDAMLRQFRGSFALSDEVAAAMRDLFASTYFPGQRDPFPALSAVRHPLPLGVPLLVVHDREDRVMPFGEAARIVAANADVRLVSTSGSGHNRVLSADATLDAVLEVFADAGDPRGRPAAGTDLRVDASRA